MTKPADTKAAPAKAAEKPRPEGDGAVVAIVGPREGRWRSVGGHAVKFGVEPQTVALTDLTKAEFAAIEADPVLAVIPVSSS